jgi:hypothetical protein
MRTISNSLYSAVCEDVRQYCLGKGYREGDGVNNFIPHDPVVAFGIARLLAGKFDQYVAVAPEGHIYAYFFERLGISVLSVFTDYPPTLCTSVDDLTVLSEKRVLIVEDDVISGRTLQLVVDYLKSFRPASISLYLGHNIGYQHIENVPEVIDRDSIYMAEHVLDQTGREKMEADFAEFFAPLLRR